MPPWRQNICHFPTNQRTPKEWPTHSLIAEPANHSTLSHPSVSLGIRPISHAVSVLLVARIGNTANVIQLFCC